jgi:bifunctional isochorismate lyase/aryl carrier protein
VKQQYFTPQTIEQKSQAMLRSLEKSLHLRRRQFAPKKSALLVLDMQEYFLDPISHAYIPSVDAILPGVEALIQAYHNRCLPVIFTQHIDASPDVGLMASWWRDAILPDNPLSNLASRLDVSTGIVIQKSQYDAFFQTALEELLHGKGVSQVVIVGVMAHLCCETTARSAFVRGFEVFFLVDGTATYNERFHRATLLNLSHGFAVPFLVKDVLSALQEKA